MIRVEGNRPGAGAARGRALVLLVRYRTVAFMIQDDPGAGSLSRIIAGRIPGGRRTAVFHAAAAATAAEHLTQ
eukprot:765018-Hanusia_phi.AAC.1